MYHPNKDKKSQHYWGTDPACNRCLDIGITLIDGKIMRHHNREELYSEKEKMPKTYN